MTTNGSRSGSSTIAGETTTSEFIATDSAAITTMSAT